MKITKLFLLMSTTMLLFSGGCGNEGATSPLGNQQQEFFQGYRQPDRHFVMNRRATGEYDKYNRFGFGRETTETAYGGQTVPEFAVYDRTLMAETISKLVVSLNEVKEAAALVTDQHVLIVYDPVDDFDRNLTATQVKKISLFRCSWIL
ncbi:MAG: YhcN/YlaJ family sporulation lipoprotein [Bacillus sp. (in: Bacteria)]|nr:YhcN/YlaJ family sporulation lipoprotein [Bacillus sp. (in: firmicutes)]